MRDTLVELGRKEVRRGVVRSELRTARREFRRVTVILIGSAVVVAALAPIVLSMIDSVRRLMFER